MRNGRLLAMLRKRKTSRTENVRHPLIFLAINAFAKLLSVFVIISPCRRLFPVTQHLSESIAPFGNEGVGQLRYLVGRGRMTTPHCRLRSLVSCVVWDELTKTDEKLFSLIGKSVYKTYSV
jgi:hypothetical protein